MFDLNNLYYYAAIVEAGSLSGASRVLGVTKSLLSQHLARLERELGVALIQRTTRTLKVTPLGIEFYRRCQAVLAEVERARMLIDDERDTPRGTLRISCPVLFAQVMLAPLMGRFLREHPQIELIVDASYRDVDPVGDGYDLAFRTQPDVSDSRLVVKSFGVDHPVLVAGAGYFAGRPPPRNPEDLAGVHGAAPPAPGAHPHWDMLGPDGAAVSIPHRARLVSADILVLREAVLADVGVALLPLPLCSDALADGRMIRLLPDHHGAMVNLHVVYPSLRGLSHAARCFLEYLGEHLTSRVQDVANGSLLLEIGGAMHEATEALAVIAHGPAAPRFGNDGRPA